MQNAGNPVTSPTCYTNIADLRTSDAPSKSLAPHIRLNLFGKHKSPFQFKNPLSSILNICYELLHSNKGTYTLVMTTKYSELLGTISRKDAEVSVSEAG